MIAPSRECSIAAMREPCCSGAADGREWEHASDGVDETRGRGESERARARLSLFTRPRTRRHRRRRTHRSTAAYAEEVDEGFGARIISNKKACVFNYNI